MARIKKILQEIAYLLRLNNGRMNLIKIIKELYLADRLSIDEREESISGDTFYSLKNGPILSAALDILTSDLMYYSEYFAKEPAEDPKERYYDDIILKQDPGQDCLSKNDKKYLEHVFNKYKAFKAFELVDETHKLPEWTPLESGRKEISFADILKALGRSEQDIININQDNATISKMDRILSGVCCE